MNQMSYEGFASSGKALSICGRIENKSNNDNRGKNSNGYKGHSKFGGKGDKFRKYCRNDNHFL